MLEGLPLPANTAVFAAAAALLWIAGTRIARYADAIAEKTGLGREVLGIVLLGGVTSLPEMAVASTASNARHPALSVNDLLGSAAINVVIIALADAALGRDAITSFGALLAVVLTAIYLVGMIERRDRTILRMGYDSFAVLGVYLAGVAVL